MNQLRQRAAKIERLRSVEQGKFDTLVAELNAIRHSVAQLQKQQQQIVDAITILSNNASPDSIETIQHRLAWNEELQRRWASVGDLIQAEIRKQDQATQRVMEQKAAIKGWEHLLTQIDADLTAETNKRLEIEADDAYMNRHARMTR